MTEDPISQPDDLANLEQFIRDAAPRHLPSDLRARIVDNMADEPITPAKKHIVDYRLFPALAAAVILLGTFTALIMNRRPNDPKQGNVSGGLPIQSELEQVAFGTCEVGREPLGPIIDVKGQPVRLVKSYELATQVFEEPESGAVVQISYPQTRYRFVNSPIQ